MVLVKSVELPRELQPTDAEVDAAIPEAQVKSLQDKRAAYLAENREIPESFETAETSPIELVVEKGKTNELTIDVAKYRTP